MLSDREILLGVAVPGLFSACLMLVVVWRRWGIALPAVSGIAIMAGYGMLRHPGLPPQDGSDWLFWMVYLLATAGIGLQRLGAKWAGMGAVAGAVVFVVLRPIAPEIGWGAVWEASAVAAMWGVAAAVALPWAGSRFGAGWVVLGLASVVGAAGVLVASSNFLAYGVCGMGAAVAIVPVALGLEWMEWRGAKDASAGVRGMTLVAIGFLAGLLAGGRYYPHAGVTSYHFHLFGAAPLLIAWPALLRGKRRWVLGLAAFGGVSALVWGLAIPRAVAAEKDALAASPVRFD